MGIGLGRLLAALVEGGASGVGNAYDDLQKRKLLRDREEAEQSDRERRLGLEQHRLDIEEHDRQAQDSERNQKEDERRAAAEFVASLPEGPVREAAQAAYHGIHGLQPNDFQHVPTQDELHNTTEQDLPESQRSAFHFNGHKPPSGGYKTDDFLTPEQRSAKEAADAKTKRDEHLATFEGEERIRQKFAKTPVTMSDDPALPTGVKSYISSLPSKYQGNYAAAFGEFQQALPSLLHDHPRLDVGKARQAFDDLFPSNKLPARPSAGSEAIDSIFNGGGAAAPAAPAPDTTPAPVGATPITRRATAPAPAGPGGAPVTDADLETIARSVLASSGRAVTPDTVRMFIARNRARLQQQVLQARGTATR
jgi:hypothetical protein